MRRGEYGIRDTVEQCVQDRLYPGGRPLEIVVTFDFVAASTSEGRSWADGGYPIDEMAPTIYISVYEDFEGLLGLYERREELANEGTQDRGLERAWFLKTNRVDGLLSNVFGELWGYPQSILYSMTFIVTFFRDDDSGTQTPYYCHSSEIPVIYYVPFSVGPRSQIE
ncbi:hypothetical protein ANO14919_079840 [Xylariales sp. No.14919]|nr:hypothetical protein ANO14919_079840 [Xylariales sp. No.14919]